MSELIHEMKKDMELRGYSPTTIKYYTDHIGRIAKHFNKSPDAIVEDQIKEYLHYCITEKKICEDTVNVVYSALKFFYKKTLGREWNVEKLARTKKHKKLPVVLSQSEVKAILDATTNLKHKAILMTIYAAGLRVSEAANLKVMDIDSKNMQIFIRNAKGKKDRYAMLSKTNLGILREYWKRYRPNGYLFVGADGKSHITTRSIQLAFEKSRDDADIKKEVSVHTLRHSFATHLLEAGTDICYIQKLLGHTSINTTTVYLHLRRMDILNIVSPLDSL